MTLACALALACEAGAPPAPSPPPPADPALSCSQAHRELARWQKNEAAECGPDLANLIEVTPLGQGRLLFRRRFTEPDELWRMRRDGTFEPQPVKVVATRTETIDPRVAGFTLLPGVPTTSRVPQVLMHDPRLAQWRLFGVLDPEPDPAGYPSLLLVSPLRGEWPSGFWKGPFVQPWGHVFVGLEDGHLLDVDVADGSSRVWRFAASPDVAASLQPPGNLASGPRAAFRNGHHLVFLGPGRLLEWAPRPCPRAPGQAPPRCLGADYHVWSYALAGDSAPRDPFDAEPVASGFWPQIGAEHDIVTADDDRLVVWNRASGQLRSYALAPRELGAAAPDPLAGPELGALVDARLQSLGWDPPSRSPELRRLVIIVQDGRSFDSYFGQYCQGAASADGAPPACDTGPSCCEAMPASIPGAPACRKPDPESDVHRPNDSAACMRAKMRDGAMDGFADAAPPASSDAACGNAADFACAGAGQEAGAVAAYHGLARRGALADRFFQSYVFADGAAAAAYPSAYEQNFLYLVTARFNADPLLLFDHPVLTKELARVHVPWAAYAGPAGLGRLAVFGLPVFYDPAWTPYRALAGEFEADLAAGLLPSVSIVLPDAGDLERSEAAGQPFGGGIRFVERIAGAVAASPQANDTLVLLAYATAGGYFDHVRPPPAPPLKVDGTSGGADPNHPVPYGPRVPLLALGRFARPDHVSHVPLEMSSLAVFVEWNWVYGQQLKGAGHVADPRAFRDTAVNNLGSLLDAAQTGVEVPAGRE